MNLQQRIALQYFRTKFRVLSAISKKKAAVSAMKLFKTPLRRHIVPLSKFFQIATPLEFVLQNDIVKGFCWNKGGTKKALICHGYESSITNFEIYIEQLVKKNYEVYAFDAPAHGRSTGKNITVPQYAEMIKTIIEKYGPVHSFIGHSLGGLSLAMALEEIELPADTRVIFIAPATESTTSIDNFFSLLKINEGVRKEFDEIIRKAIGKNPEWLSVARVVQNLQAQILWLHDEDDNVTPLKDVKPVQEKNHPHIRFVITKGLGHRRIYRDANVVHTITEFL